MSTRYVGTCPVCSERYKVRGGDLVHHGYQRPGFGHIVGDCFAVGRPPHESTPETARAYGEFMAQHREGLEKNRAHVESADELHYQYTVYEGLGRKTPKFAHVKRGDELRYEDHNRIPSFSDVRAGLLRQLDHQIRSANEEVARMEGLVASWTLRPLTTWEEETQRITEAKKAALAAKKAERAEKNAAKNQRRAERQERLKQKIDAARQKAHAILDAVDSEDIAAVRLAYLKVLEIKLPADVQYSFYDQDLGRTELLEGAGLMHNGRAMNYEWQVRDLISGRKR